MTRGAVPIALLLAAMLSLQPPTPLDFDRGLRDVMTRSLQFTASELAELQRGRAVKHGLEARAPGEFGVAGAIKVAAAKGAFLDAARDIVRFKAAPEVLQIGRFSAVPVSENANRLTRARAAPFDATDRNAATSVDAPSKTSGHQK